MNDKDKDVKSVKSLETITVFIETVIEIRGTTKEDQTVARKVGQLLLTSCNMEWFKKYNHSKEEKGVMWRGYCRFEVGIPEIHITFSVSDTEVSIPLLSYREDEKVFEEPIKIFLEGMKKDLISKFPEKIKNILDEVVDVGMVWHGQTVYFYCPDGVNYISVENMENTAKENINRCGEEVVKIMDEFSIILTS